MNPMKFLNNVVLSVFCRSEEDAQSVKKSLAELVPLNLEEEKIRVVEQTAEGFNDQKIKIFTITLTKQSHTNAFLKMLLAKLTAEQKEMLVQQRESRLDNDLNFFMRLDKDKLINDRAMSITDSGNCFHIKLHLAAYPARRPDALVLVEKIFKPD